MDNQSTSYAWRARLCSAESASREGARSRAELLYKQALSIAKDLGNEEKVTSLIHLADFYSGGQDFAKAEPLYRQAAELYESIFGPRNLIGAICLRSLGETLEALGKNDEAQAVKSRAMDILATLG